MSEILNKIRNELYKISEIDMEDELGDSNYIEEFILNIRYFRDAPEEEVIESYRKIFYWSTTHGMKLLFFIRDKYRGLGERRIFRILIKYLANEHPSYMISNLKLIPKYGRWDDLYSLFDTKLEKNVAEIFRMQIKLDLTSRKPSTLGKWLKSENTSSMESKKLGCKTRKLLGYSPKEYRKILSTLRKKLNIVESNLSNKEYYKIDYNNITKTNIKIYKKTFLKKDKLAYEKFILEKDSNKFPYDDLLKLIGFVRKNLINKGINTIEDMYMKNMEFLLNKEIGIQDYFQDTLIINALSIEAINTKEVSIDILIMMVLLYKKVNLNNFKNYYIYFDNNFKFNKLLGSNCIEDIKIMLNSDFNNRKMLSNDVNLESALDILLFSIIKNNFETNFAPKSVLYIYNSQENIKTNNINQINNKWFKSGYNIPEIKLWNLNGLDSNFFISKKDDFIEIKGYNRRYLRYLIKGKEINNNKFIINKFNKIYYHDLKLT